MASTGDMLSTAVSGLQAFQRNLATTGHNITTANTEGYSRQTVELATRNPISSASGFIGTGVNVASIQRVYDQFLSAQVTSSNSTFNQLDTMQQLSSAVDDLLGDSESGLNPVLQSFFNAMQDVANNPTSTPSRQVLISEADTLASRFVSMDNVFSNLQENVNDQITAVTNEISGIAESIVGLNKSIVLETGASGGQPPNDLLDQRDLLVNQLAELVSVQTVTADDGSLNVFIGNGQTLVLGSTANTIGTVRNEYDPSQVEVSFSSSTINYSISKQISGGKLGGLLEFRDQILEPTQNSMGHIAIGLAATVNAQHQLGDDINGNPGGLFFNSIVTSSPEVLPSSGNNPASGTVSVAISDTNNMQASDYRLNYDGATFSLLRLSDNTVVDSGFAIADFPRAVASDGLVLSLAGGVAAGDSFLVRPVHGGAADIDVAISSGADVAAAASGSSLGDNSNALALAALQLQKVLAGGTETYQSAYASLVGSVGADTSQAISGANAQRTLLTRAIESEQSVSGVNLDEEAANLIKFQQAYQAAAQVISVSDDIFQTLLSVTSR
ncbi:MAG: flagellar hook-associated protein FlgK [Porticoccus sp.]|nr:flagellar hook-associated protein FlgK [Porticoccus sp.]